MKRTSQSPTSVHPHACGEHCIVSVMPARIVLTGDIGSDILLTSPSGCIPVVGNWPPA